jgi:hypothetical protein
LVVVAASKEPMTHHALGEQKKNNRQDDCKQEMPNSTKVAFVLILYFPGGAAATSL